MSMASTAGAGAVSKAGSSLKPRSKKKSSGSRDSNILHYQHGISQARRSRDHGIRDARNLFNRGIKDNQYIAAEVRDYLNSINIQNRKGFNATAAQQAAANALLQSTMQSNTDVNAGNASAELARLGIQQSGLGDFQQDANFAKMIASQTGANDISNTNTAANNSAAIGRLLLGMNQGERQSNVGKLTNKKADAITGLNDDYNDFKLSQMDAISEYRARKAEQDRAIAAARAQQAQQQRYYASRYSSGGSSYSGGSSAAQRAAQNRGTIGLIGGIQQNSVNKPKAGSSPDLSGYDPDLVKLLLGPLT